MLDPEDIESADRGDDELDPAVRFIDRDQGIIAGLIVPFTGPLPGDKDLYGTRFSASTDLCLDWFPDGGRPGLYSHGLDEDVAAEVVGRELRSWTEKGGRWLEAQIDKAHRYADEIRELVDQGLLSLSSGAMSHLVRINSSTRDVERWPWVEWSLVPNPGNPEALIYQVRSADALLHISAEQRADIALRITEAEPTITEPLPLDTLRAGIRSLVESMNPQALHDLASDMGASCPFRASEEAEASPLVSISWGEPVPGPLSDDDLASIRQQLEASAEAVAVAKVRQLIR